MTFRQKNNYILKSGRKNYIANNSETEESLTDEEPLEIIEDQSAARKTHRSKHEIREF